MNITSEHQIIDYESIETGANQLLNVAESFEECSKKLNEAAAICDDSALSVDGKSYHDKIYELAEQMSSMAIEIVTYVSNVITKASELYNQQTTQYNNYIASSQVQNGGDGS